MRYSRVEFPSPHLQAFDTPLMQLLVKQVLEVLFAQMLEILHSLRVSKEQESITCILVALTV